MFVRLGWSKATKANPHGTMLPPDGHQLIVNTLCRMRGAVLKLGQMLSIQDESTVPSTVSALFQQVRDSAFAMPLSQLNTAMASGLGTSDWRGKFTSFQDEPVAAASIGQVHFATITHDQFRADGATKHHEGENQPYSSTWDSEGGTDDGSCMDTAPPASVAENGDVAVAVKCQYPGVAKSIDSDVSNLKMLMKLNILPPGLFVGNILQELKQELTTECQYTIEASKQSRYRKLVREDEQLGNIFYVPKVLQDLTSDSVLTTEFIQGTPIDTIGPKTKHPLGPMSQEMRNKVCEAVMRLTLTELFVWRFMQTDPNYANFLVQPKHTVSSHSEVTDLRINLLDFGAAREYERGFVKEYLEVVTAATRLDKEEVIARSITLGFLTGKESKEMLDAHTQSVFILGKPFRGHDDHEGAFNFTKENLPGQLQKLVPTMLKLRLRPPPSTIYSLHRRISGTILLSTQLGATYDVGSLFQEAAERSGLR